MTKTIKFNFTPANRDLGAIGETIEVEGLEGVYEFLRYQCSIQLPNTPKNKLSRFIPSIFKGDRRTTEDFVSTQLLVLDVDEGDPTEFLTKLTEGNIGFILYETPSSTQEQPKYRIITTTSTPITSTTQFKQTYKHLFDGKVPYDPACNDPSRLFYIPNSSKLETFFLNEGNPLYVSTSVEVVDDLDNLESSQESDNSESFFLESGEIVALKLQKILQYLKEKNLSITPTHQKWIAVCFACVSLKAHNISKSACLEYFISFSKLDKDKCASQEELIKKFDYCWNHTQNSYSIATIYFYAKEVGCPLPKINPEIIKMVKGEEKGNYYLALNNTESDDIVHLYADLYTPIVARSKVKITDADIFALKKNEIQFWDAEDERFRYTEDISDFMARHIKQPDKVCYLLGADKYGRFYEKSSNTLLTANHYKVPCKATFHQDIHNWLSQLNIPTDWLYEYIYYVTDLSVALPIIHCYGVSNAGKTLLCKLVASIWNTSPIEDYIDEKGGFKDTAGTNPIILFDEKIPNRPDEIKNIVTSNMVSIRQKYKTAMYVKGYSRIFTAVNDDFLTFPAFSSSDNGALLRRIQPIQFTQNNVDYLEKIGGVSVTSSWLSSAFREHCKYVRENPQAFNFKKRSTDILALSPIKTANTDKKSFTFNREHRVIQEYFYHKSCNVTKQENKECVVFVDAFFEDLLKNRIINKRLSVQEMESILKKPIREHKGVFRRDTNSTGASRWRVSKTTVLEILKDFGLDEEINNLEVEKD